MLAHPPNTTKPLGNAAAAGLAPDDANPPTQGAMDPKSKPGPKAVGMQMVHPGVERLEQLAQVD